MDRRPKRNLDIGEEKNYIVWIVWILVIVGISTVIISYAITSNKAEEGAQVGEYNVGMNTMGNNMLNIVPIEELSETSLTLGKSVNELENSIGNQLNEKNTEISENVEKMAVNTSELEKEVVAQRNEEKNQKEENNLSESEQSSEITFIKPVDGEIVKKYSKDNLIYSETLQEWTTHLGIDYKAEKTSIVKASADGKIRAIKNDPRYGLTVVIEHKNGYTSMYSNLLSTEFIDIGEEVKAGQTIATVGNTAAFEIADESHLHFEILKDGVNVDPELYIK